MISDNNEYFRFLAAFKAIEFDYYLGLQKKKRGKYGLLENLKEDINISIETDKREKTKRQIETQLIIHVLIVQKYFFFY